MPPSLLAHKTYHNLPTKYPEVGGGGGKVAGAERGSQGLNQEEELLQHCQQLPLIWVAFPRRWGGTRRDTCSARLSSNKEVISGPLNPDYGAASPGEQELGSRLQAEDVGREALLFLLLFPQRLPCRVPRGWSKTPAHGPGWREGSQRGDIPSQGPGVVS